MTDDTIFAVSSGSPPAAISIIRLSGPAAFTVARVLGGALPAPRRAGVRALRDPRDGLLLDRALVLIFPGPRTATGEDVVELHVHGGRAVVAAVQTAIAACEGTRVAVPGEFTRRALERGVIDLTEAEGLADLLSAQTEAQRRAALRMAEGGVREAVDRWTERLVAIAARIEAQLDFSDEDDVADEVIETVAADIARIEDEIAQLLVTPTVDRLHDGVRVVIAGPPNSGKSSLLNALVARDVAIVSPISGTTRDRIEAGVVRNGVAYLLTDTAGLTVAPGDDVERIGVARARDAVAAADIVLWLGEPHEAKAGYIRVHARSDLAERAIAPRDTDVIVSARTGMGMAAIWETLAAGAAKLIPAENSVAINRRQRTLLEKCSTSLTGVAGRPPLVIAEDVRHALRALDEIGGRGGIERVLDAIFANFCIGK